MHSGIKYIFFVAMLIGCFSSSMHAQVVAGKADYTYFFLRTMASDQTERAIKVDVDGDGIWDFRFYSSAPYPPGWDKSSTTLYMKTLNTRSSVCRDLVYDIFKPFTYGNACVCDTQSKRTWTTSGEITRLGHVVWHGQAIYPKLTDNYIAVRVRRQDGKEVYGWLKFSQSISPNGFWFALTAVGADTDGWKPTFEVEEVLPTAKKKAYDDVIIPEITPPDSTDEGGDTIVVEPPPPFVDSTLQTYPNPFSDELTVNLQDIEDINRVELLDFQGNLVYQERLYKSQILTIPTTNLQPGQYILRVVRYAHPPSLHRVMCIHRRE